MHRQWPKMWGGALQLRWKALKLCEALQVTCAAVAWQAVVKDFTTPARFAGAGREHRQPARVGARRARRGGLCLFAAGGVLLLQHHGWDWRRRARFGQARELFGTTPGSSRRRGGRGGGWYGDCLRRPRDGTGLGKPDCCGLRNCSFARAPFAT
jgi:hypothetical protein